MTAVVVLAIPIANDLPADEIWISYGTGNNLRSLSTHQSATKIGTGEIKSIANVSYYSRVRHSFIFQLNGKEDSMGRVECLPDPTNRSFSQRKKGMRIVVITSPSVTFKSKCLRRVCTVKLHELKL